ncbi:hypothetical protein [Salipiger sp.]|uniref:hypothetical protein n=1 Tax=Salipiger sp. TaxID=2078585 RepID=UPI003A971086
MKSTLLIGAVAAMTALSACGGGGGSVSRNAGPDYRVARMASGPISRACVSSDRKARSPELCGCIQGAANIELTGADQRMAVSFYKDPHKAQEVRQSDRSSHEDFWKRYKSYVDRAESQCRGL